MGESGGIIEALSAVVASPDLEPRSGFRSHMERGSVGSNMTLMLVNSAGRNRAHGEHRPLVFITLFFASGMLSSTRRWPRWRWGPLST